MRRVVNTHVWRKSSYSGTNPDQCLEVSDGHVGVVPVRDSKLAGAGPVLHITRPAWAAFVRMAKAGV
ncbi:hypothetical protein CH313_18485 [Streptomyces sp. TSRI0384-2]|uniref:DUF397 domain-containing protein n=1 Tax=Streptomyces rutgersensis TaxID=53451 RepID=A0ABX6RPS9_9ACTN|nr:DUF397 domain-containing protein [Streptomyces sp. TSRI0384-2]NEE32757.1 DUF397 domain-containing protein [Streptomyces sp. SID7982]PJM81954.1 hypothetical protein CH313_18485 [Streptomyces sp. TSRI0384-2]QNE82630.1 DUF397 domain-containing protein [Streptomyces rutgersensis]WSU36267.1 DUF397 domain-containing protein [Streptomyces gougerotii]